MRAFTVRQRTSPETLDSLHINCVAYDPLEDIFWFQDGLDSSIEKELSIWLSEGILIKRRHFNIISGMAFQATIEALGWDIYMKGYATVPSKGVGTLSTGLKTEMSTDLFAEIRGRSGLALRGLDVMGGMIDSDFRDEWKVIVANHGPQPLAFNDGDRIAQFVIKVKPILSLEGRFLVGTTARKGGFGSTGA